MNKNNNEFDGLIDEFIPKETSENTDELAAEKRLNNDNLIKAEEPSPTDTSKLKFDVVIDYDKHEEDVVAPKEPIKSKVKKKKKKGKTFNKVMFALVIVALSLLASSLILVSTNDILALYKTDKVVIVEIKKGWSTKQIADALKNKGIVSFSWLFRGYSKINEADGTYQYGMYTLNSKMGYEEIIANLKKIAPKKDTVSITFQEGLTLNVIAKRLEENKICNAREFLSYIHRNNLGYSFEKDIKEDPYRFYRLEGYMFPDTYEFFINEPFDSIAKKFLDNFQSKIEPVWYTKMKEMGLTLDETLILASIIEKEAGKVEEMGRVSSVFHNRLNNESLYPKLQSDVTILYVENDIKPYIDRKNQKMYDAYNTYVCTGLSVAPICNPSKNAIKATLYPETTDYYFFVTDITGKYYYAKTFAEHQRNCSTATRVGLSHGTATA